MYVYCVESFVYIECYSLNPFATVLFNVCSAVTLEWVVLCIRVAWVCLVCLLLCKKEGSSPVSAIAERRDMGMYEVLLSITLLGFGMGTMLANCHMCGIMLVLRAVFNMLFMNARCWTCVWVAWCGCGWCRWLGPGYGWVLLCLCAL